MTIDELTNESAKQLCKLFGQDPDSHVPVRSQFAGANTYAPLWETVTPQMREFIMMNEAVKAAMRSLEKPAVPAENG